MAKVSSSSAQKTSSPNIDAALAALKEHASEAVRTGMTRFAIPSERAFGVSMGNIQAVAKRLGKSHQLAAELWKTGWYEARMLAAYVDDSAEVTPTQMDHWSRDFDNWAICDTLCFALFDRTPHAWKKVQAWSTREEEFVKRGAFAILWGLTVHDKTLGDEPFVDALLLIEAAANDDRHFVKKGVNMALRGIGKRNATLHGAALALAEQLAASAAPATRWIGKDAVRELKSPAVVGRLERKCSSLKKPPRSRRK